MTLRNLTKEYNKNYKFLYEMCGNKTICKTIEQYTNAFFEEMESGDEEFKRNYEMFCQKRHDACTSDREIAAYMISYKEVFKEKNKGDKDNDRCNGLDCDCEFRRCN